MVQVEPEVCVVAGVELWPAVDHQQVFSVAVLGLVGEVEAAGDDRLAVDQDDLVVGDRVLGVDIGGDSIGRDFARVGMFFQVAFVEHDRDFHAAMVRIDQGMGDWLGGERVGLHLDHMLGLFDLLHHPLGAAAFWGKVDRDPVFRSRRSAVGRKGRAEIHAPRSGRVADRKGQRHEHGGHE